ncbi:hypothetical protein FN846DRAFT_901809 [Sphaerosporella brunnea]|uniref:Uncharacterized protein n=1 Tax=Sphaerosporella brunnea TaxID=1250544 RepID=A0A5J5FAT5_9PEZI|nr:hypothetical protein FN846DRAFT_901809 [Sphaerosporella brunnea]
MTTTLAATDRSDDAWRASALNLGLTQGMLMFVLPGESDVYHLDRDLVDTWEVGNPASSLGLHWHLGWQNLTFTVADKFQIELDVVYDMFNNRIDSRSWDRVSRTSPYAFGCFKVTGLPVLSHTRYTACFRFLLGVSIKFRLPRIAYLTLPELREIILGFVGALRLLRGARKISVNLLRRMNLESIKQDEYTYRDFLKHPIWVIAEPASAPQLEETENDDCHAVDAHKPATYIAITQEWHPSQRDRKKCPTTIKQMLLPGSTLADQIQQTVTEDFEALEENIRFTITSVEMLTYVDGNWVQLPDPQWRLEDFDGPVRVVLIYMQEW